MPVCRTGAPTHAPFFALSFFRRTRAPKACGIPCQRPGYRRTPAPCRTVPFSLPSTTENLLTTIRAFARSFSPSPFLSQSLSSLRLPSSSRTSSHLCFPTPFRAPISSLPLHHLPPFPLASLSFRPFPFFHLCIPISVDASPSSCFSYDNYTLTEKVPARSFVSTPTLEDNINSRN